MMKPPAVVVLFRTETVGLFELRNLSERIVNASYNTLSELADKWNESLFAMKEMTVRLIPDSAIRLMVDSEEKKTDLCFFVVLSSQVLSKLPNSSKQNLAADISIALDDAVMAPLIGDGAPLSKLVELLFTENYVSAP